MPITQDDELLKKVTATLVGEFYIGQRVRVVEPLSSFRGELGTITALSTSSYSTTRYPAARLILDVERDCGGGLRPWRPWFGLNGIEPA